MEKLAGFFSLDRLYNYLGLLCGGLAAALIAAGLIRKKK